MDRQLRILLLQADVPEAELIERELARDSIQFESQHVTSGGEFVRALGTSLPDLILADHTLPGFSALEVLSLLKERNWDVPVIIVTGSDAEENIVRCLKEGADDYVLKASLRRLPSAVRNVLRKRLAERQRAASEAAFQRSEEQYRLIAENTRDLVCLLDLQFQFIYVSPSSQGLLGWAPRQLLGTRCLDLLHP